MLLKRESKCVIVHTHTHTHIYIYINDVCLLNIRQWHNQNNDRFYSSVLTPGFHITNLLNCLVPVPLLKINSVSLKRTSNNYLESLAKETKINDKAFIVIEAFPVTYKAFWT